MRGDLAVLPRSTVVSGMARGVNTAAHNFMLGQRRRRSHAVDAGLLETICGCPTVVAEMADGSAPQSWHPPQGSPIIVSLSTGAVVAPAAMCSGWLITASMALEHCCGDFAVHGCLCNSLSTGADYLLCQGAVLNKSANDVPAKFKENAARRTGAPSAQP